MELLSKGFMPAVRLGEKLRHSYPWYVADWRLSDARMRLNSEERGIYRELLDHLYYTGFLPNDEQSLIKIASASTKEWRNSRIAVLSCFITSGDGLVNRKATEVIEKIDGYSEAMSEAGRKGAAKRWHRKDSQAIKRPLAKNTQPLPLPLPRPSTPAQAAPEVPSARVDIYKSPSSEPSPPKPQGVESEVQDAFIKKSASEPEPKPRITDTGATDRLANILGVDPVYIDQATPRRQVAEDPSERKAAEERFEAALRKERPDLDDAGIARMMRRAK